MAITDELRKYVGDFYLFRYKDVRESLIAIADRIDAEHHAAIRRWMAELDAAREQSFRAGFDDGFASADDWLAQHEDAMREHGWVKLPKDADGEYIHIGDTVEWVTYDNTYPSVVREVDAVGNGVFFAWDKANGRFAQYEAYAYRHHKQPTVEDVLREFVYAILNQKPELREENIAEYAAKLTLRGDE